MTSTGEQLDAVGSRILRRVGVAAVVAGALSLVAALLTGWLLHALSVTPVTPLVEAGGYALNALPLCIVVSIVLAIVAGARGGRGRRLGLIAGLLTLATIPAVCLVSSIPAAGS
ncbi:hypothetical protein [Frondihabitans australicus]|nr:hypothetical protein [Frondihabitans australicus]